MTIDSLMNVAAVGNRTNAYAQTWPLSADFMRGPDAHWTLPWHLRYLGKPSCREPMLETFITPASPAGCKCEQARESSEAKMQQLLRTSAMSVLATLATS